MSRSIYILAGGGTGGHLYPGLAVARQLLELADDALVVFACSDRAIDRRILQATGHCFVCQPVRPLPRRAREAPGFLRAWMGSKVLASRLVKDLKPKAILGLGGFAAAPVISAASESVRCGLLNPDAVPGKANRYLARRVAAIFTQFESTELSFRPSLRRAVRCVGCPVRGELVGADRMEAISSFGLRPDRKTLLVLGGSTGAASINEAIGALAEDLDAVAESWQLLHITGPGGKFDADQAYRKRRLGVRTIKYCDRMDLAYAAADLALCRGGASTIAELAATSTPALVMPYPHHRDLHQARNAAALVEAGAALCVDDARSLSVNLDTLRVNLLPLLSDPSRLAAMKSATGQLAKPDAAAQVARWLAGADGRASQADG